MEASPLIGGMVSRGYTGRKGGAGFYVYGRKKPSLNADVARVARADGLEKDMKISAEEIARRPVWPMINEAARCLEEGVVREAADVDTGMVFGTGFPPFRGGLLRYADDAGISLIRDTLERWREKLGERFAVAPLLAGLADKGFYA